MNILFIDWKCFGKDGTISAMKELGHKVFTFYHEDYVERKSEKYMTAFSDFVKEHPVDLCFSYNYYPVVAECCKDHEIKYISFLYDNPFVMLYSYTLAYPTNYVFLFDSVEYNTFKAGGLNNVYYHGLHTSVGCQTKLFKKSYDKSRLSADVSFIGQLYHEEHTFYDRITAAGDEYLNAYMQGIMDAQMKVYGYNFIEELLTPEILNRLHDAYPYEPDKYSAESPTYVYAHYFINRKITSLERHKIINRLGAEFPERIKLFTTDQRLQIPGVKNMGVAEYFSEMPLVFNQSKINLNITLRSIRAGIPLRCMDIMGCGGFLLSNYQPDLVSFFTPGEEMDVFESEDDLMTKVEYYLSHEKERAEIAENGFRKVKELYNFKAVLQDIFEIVGN